MKQAEKLTSLQHFVLGGFRDVPPEHFIEVQKKEKESLNAQIRYALKMNSIKPLEKITVAELTAQGIRTRNAALFHKQLNTYENLPGVLDKFPKLTSLYVDPQRTVSSIRSAINELRPECRTEARLFGESGILSQNSASRTSCSAFYKTAGGRLGIR
ncbi:hypothetical protein V8U11_06215 [Pseudomonas chlororaphis]|uniref:hypothetical protein n=1 Tax=Pseudomonas chlororaphis TaxID=587753 RepID=UPI0030CC2AC9